MATYNTAFGSLPGYNEMLGTTNTTGGGQQQVYGQRAQQQRQQQQQPAPAQTFAQMQQRGMARPPAPSAPQAQPFQQYGGSQQAQQMRQRLQQQLEQFGQAPSRFDTQAFQQIRGAQQANIQSEFQDQQQRLNEDLARRGLSASNIAASGLGRLGGAQARALADIDAQLLQRAAETQAQDRAQLLAAGQGLAELAGSQDLQQFEANRVAQAATFENQLRAAQFGQQQFEQAGQEAFQGAQAEEAAQQAARQFDLAATGQAAGLSMDLQRLLGQQELDRAQLTGQLGGMQTLAGRQFGEQQRQFDIQQALQSQLGLGGLSLQQRQQMAQEQQFGLSLAEQQAQRLQQGGLSQQEIGLRAQQLQQEAATQGRQLSLEEARLQVQQQQFGATQAQQQAQFAAQLGISQQELGLRNQQLQQEAQQFGLTLNEQQASRMQQYGLSVQELGLQAQRLQQDAALQGRQLSLQEAQNQAQNTLERDRLIQQGQQFGLNLDETRAARLQQYGLSTQELGLRSQQIQQEAALQGRQLSITEAQNLAQNQLEQQRIVNQSAQFGLQLNEQQAARLQQSGFTAQELALESQRVANQASQFGQQMSAQERQNQALNALEERKLNEDVSFRSQQLGLNRDELTQRATQIREDQRLRGVEITNEQAFREAELGLRTTQVQNEFARSGQQIGVEQARIQAQRDIANAENAAQLARLDRQLASQAALQTQELEARAGESALERELRQTLQATDIMSQLETQSRQQTFQAGESDLERQARASLQSQQLTEQARQFNLEQSLRQALGMTEATGYLYQPLSSGKEVGALGGIQQTMARQAEAARQSQATLDFQLRQALGLAETTGYVYDMSGSPTTQQTVQSRLATAQQRMAENDFLMRLISTMGTAEMGKGIQDFISNRQTSGGAQGTGGDGGGDNNTFYLPTGSLYSGPDGPSNDGMPPAQDANVAAPVISQLSSVLGVQQPSTNTISNPLAGQISGGNTNILSALAAILGRQRGAISTPGLSNTLALTAQPLGTSSTAAPRDFSSVLRNNPSLAAYQQRLSAMSPAQRAQYVAAERIPSAFYDMAVPDTAMPGTVYNNYRMGDNGVTAGDTYLGYDGTGFLPLAKRVQPIAGGAGMGNFYYTATGQRWA